MQHVLKVTSTTWYGWNKANCNICDSWVQHVRIDPIYGPLNGIFQFWQCVRIGPVHKRLEITPQPRKLSEPSHDSGGHWLQVSKRNVFTEVGGGTILHESYWRQHTSCLQRGAQLVQTKSCGTVQESQCTISSLLLGSTLQRMKEAVKAHQTVSERMKSLHCILTGI